MKKLFFAYLLTKLAAEKIVTTMENNDKEFIKVIIKVVDGSVQVTTAMLSLTTSWRCC